VPAVVSQTVSQVATPVQCPTSASNSSVPAVVSQTVSQVAISPSIPVFAQVLSHDVAHVVNPALQTSIPYNRRQCRTTLRNVDGSIPLPPYDLTVARFEKRSYRDKFGELHTPQREQAVHYHIKLSCIKSACADFVPASLVVPSDVQSKLPLTHKE
jgi:hypothetical protein